METIREVIEREIEKRIRAKTEVMHWRADYEDWVQGRIWQERYQEPTLWNLQHYVGGDLVNAVILDLGSGMGGGESSAFVRRGSKSLVLIIALTTASLLGYGVCDTASKH